jgi:hypothetical protein
MTPAHQGVPVAQLPGTEIVPYLLAQTPPTEESGGWGNFAANNPNPDEATSNEQRSRNWIFRDNDAPPPQQQVEPVRQRGGFFKRLFGG